MEAVVNGAVVSDSGVFVDASYPVIALIDTPTDLTRAFFAEFESTAPSANINRSLTAPEPAATTTRSLAPDTVRVNVIVAPSTFFE